MMNDSSLFFNSHLEIHNMKNSKRKEYYLSVARARAEIARRNVVTLEAKIAELKAQVACQRVAEV